MKDRESPPLLRLVREVGEFAGGSGLATVAVMTLVVVSEGVGIVLLVPLLALVGVAPPEQFPAWMRGLIDDIGGSASLYVVLALFLGLITLRQLLLLQQNERVTRLRLRYVNHIRQQLLKALLQVRWRYLSRSMLHQQAQILTLDVNRIGEACELLFRLAAGLLFLVVQVAIAALLSVGFTAVALGSMLIAHWLLRDRLTLAAHRGEALTRHHNALFSILGNLKSMLRIARMTGASQRLLDDLDRETSALAVLAVAYVRDYELSRIAGHLAGAVVLSVALIVSIKVLALGPVEILLLILIFARLIPQLSTMQQTLHRLFHALPAYEHAARSVELLHERGESAADAGAPIKPMASIAMDNITAGYDDEGGEPVLRGASLDITVGEVVALTGDSGCGKSTLADVLAGLLEPAQGRLVIDGVPLDTGRVPAWRRAVGYVEQEAALFTGTLSDNLTFGMGEVAAADVERALKASRAREFVARLPDRLATHLGEHGSRLSGGQRQRIALARELLRQPHLLVLDEATSGLDAETEKELFEGLREFYPALTVLVITHRASNLRTVDRVLELRNGRICKAAPEEVAEQRIRELPAEGFTSLSAVTGR